MPRWAGALTWRCGFAAGRRGWSSGSWGRWRSATGGAGAGAGGQGAGPAGRPAGQRRPGGVGGPAGRGPVGRRPAGPGQHPPGPGVGAAPGPGAGRAGPGHQPARLPLEAGPEQVDAARFERLVAEAEAAAPAEPPRAARLLEEALGLWRGRPWPSSPTSRGPRPRRPGWRSCAWPPEALVELRLAAGGHAGLVGELEGLVAAHPTRERLRGQLMVALYRSGRQADALGLPADPRGRWPRSWGSTRRRSCSGCTRRSWSRTRPWSWPGRAGASPTTCPSA